MFCYNEVSCPFTQELEGSSPQSIDQGPVMAVLAVIGGVDNRPRLGGLVHHKEWGLGTVCKIAPNGKVTLQCEGQQKARVCSISQVKPVINAVGLHAFTSFFFFTQKRNLTKVSLSNLVSLFSPNSELYLFILLNTFCLSASMLLLLLLLLLFIMIMLIRLVI